MSLIDLLLRRNRRLPIRNDKKQKDYVPLIEALEERRAPAVFNVNTFDDTIDDNIGDGIAEDADGNTSLRAAIQEINALGDASNTINLEAGLYKLSIFGSGENLSATGDLDISENITIQGAGSGLTTINADGLDRVFEIVGADLNVNFVGVTITGGLTPDNGAGIYSTVTGGDLNLNDVTVTGNTANGDGGGIYTGATVSLTDSTVTDNTTGGDGGGIYMFEESSGIVELTLTNSTVSQNHADNEGGGIYLEADSSGTASAIINVSLTNSHVDENTAGGSGGGIWADADVDSGIGSLVQASVTVTLDNSSVDDNVSAGSGGGIYANTDADAVSDVTDAPITITLMNGSSVSRNVAAPDEEIDGVGGGGIFAHSSARSDQDTAESLVLISMSDSAVDGNVAGGSSEIGGGYNGTIGTGGGIYARAESDSGGPGGEDASRSEVRISMIDSSVDDNIAAGSGGGIYASSDADVFDSGRNVSALTEITVQNSSVSGNVSGDGEEEKNGGAGGGGIYAEADANHFTTSSISDAVVNSEVNVSIQDGSEINNNTTGGNGGGIYTAAFADGSGTASLDYSSAIDIDIDSSTVDGNTASRSGGGIYAHADSSPSFGESTSSIDISLNNSSASDNTSGAENFDHDNIGAGGGGIYALSESRGDFSTGTLDSSVSVDLVDSHVDDNTTGANGGGVYAYSLVNASFSDSSSTTDVTLTSSTVDGNIAGGQGGGIYAYGESDIIDVTVTLEQGEGAESGSSVSNNTAAEQGGGIYAATQFGAGADESVTINVSDSNVDNNTASEDTIIICCPASGGGIYAVTNANGDGPTIAETTVNLTNSSVSGNTALNHGGGIYAAAFSNSSSSDATAVTDVNVDNSTVDNNIVGSSGFNGVPFTGSGGGGIYAISDANVGSFGFQNATASTAVDVENNSSVSDNTANTSNGNNFSGGGIYALAEANANSGSSSIENATVSVIVTDSHVDRNVTDGDGGGIYAYAEGDNLIPDGVFQGPNGNYYEFVDVDVTWTEARDAAASSTLNGIAGHLVTITSQAEQDFVEWLVDGSQTWIGASDEAVEGEWRWVVGPETGTLFWLGEDDGTLVGPYANWDSSQPDALSEGEDYAHFFDDGEWNDIGNDLVRTYTIEYEVTPHVQVIITNSTVNDNVAAGDGGGIYADNESGSGNDGTTANTLVELTNSEVSGNVSGSDGGGIYAYGGPADFSTVRVLLDASHVDDNIADSDGGGIYADTGNSSNFSDFTTVVVANGSSVDDNISDEDGGGIYADTEAETLAVTTVIVSDSSVSRNSATEDGGGIYASSDAEDIASTLVDIMGSTIDDNVSVFDGGGIYAYSEANIDFAETIVSIDDSSVSRNVANVDGGGIYAESFADEDEDFEDAETVVRVTNNSSVDDNVAGFDGGGITAYAEGYDDGDVLVEIVDSSVSRNVAGTNGGGIYAESESDDDDAETTVNVINSFIDDNFAGGFEDFEEGFGFDPGNGGGIYAYADGDDDSEVFVTIDASSVSRNYAEDDGGGIYALSEDDVEVQIVNGSNVDDNSAGSDGGGIWVFGDANEDDQVLVEDSSVSGNVADSDGGGIYVGSDSFTEVEIDSSQVDNNVAGDSGGGIYAYEGGGSSGSIFVEVIDSSSVSGNTAGRDGGGIWASNREFEGGFSGVQNSSIDITVVDSNVDDNIAGLSGGGIYAAAFADDFNSCESGGECFAFANAETDIEIINSSVSRNTAGGNDFFNGEPRSGGGIYATSISSSEVDFGTSGTENAQASSDTNVYVEGSMINMNTSGTEGGGIYANSIANGESEGDTIEAYTEVVVLDSSVDLNTAAQDGGGIYASSRSFNFADDGDDGDTDSESTTDVAIYNSSINDNIAGGSGGGVYAYSGDHEGADDHFSSTSVYMNTQKDEFVDGFFNPLETDFTTISGNTAGRDGGGIYATTGSPEEFQDESSTVLVSAINAEINDNTAAGEGGGIWAESDSRSLDDFNTGFTAVLLGLFINVPAILDGGGFDLEDIEFGAVSVDGNTAGSHGGGVYADSENGATFVLVAGQPEIQFLSPEAIPSSVSGNTAGGEGGGIYATGFSESSDFFTGSVFVVGLLSEINDNIAGEAGGGIYARSGHEFNGSTGGISAVVMGGFPDVEGLIALIEGGEIPETLLNGKSTIDGNTSGGDGGGIYNASFGGPAIVALLGEIDISEEFLGENTEFSSASHNIAAGSGGGIFNYSEGEGDEFSVVATILADVSGNTAGVHGGGVYNYSTDGDGGIPDSIVFSLGSSFNDNIAGGHGGGIGADSGDFGETLVLFFDSTADMNIAGESGGGLYVNGDDTANLEIGTFFGPSEEDGPGSSASISNNVSAGSGGGVWFRGDDANIFNATINGNVAASSGGAVWVDGELDMTLSVVNDNVAGSDGGGIFLDQGSSSSIIDTTIDGNSAAVDGGGLAIGGGSGSMFIDGTTISNNRAGADGGGIIGGTSGSLFAQNTTISGNNAADEGGGIYIDDQFTVTLDFVTVADNGAEDGGNIYNESDLTLNTSNTIYAIARSGGNFSGGGTFNSTGHNLSDDDTGDAFLTNTGDMTGFDGFGDPLFDTNLGPLQDNGGPTFTHALQSGSDAIDNADPNATLPVDQRNAPRPRGAGRDIGAFEALQLVAFFEPTGPNVAEYQVDEDAGTIEITVRLNDPNPAPFAVTVDVEIEQNSTTAIQGVDFTAPTSVTFLPGEDTAIFVVTIIDDNRVCEEEAIQFALSTNNADVNVGSPSLADVEIINDEQDFDDANECWVAQVYQDIFMRDVDPGALVFWVDRINDLGGGDDARVMVARDMLRSDEYFQITVNSLYNRYLDRNADAGGLAFFVNQMQMGASQEDVATQLVTSGEYTANFGATNTDFVNSFFMDALCRAPTTDELNDFVADLDGGLSRTDLADQVFEDFNDFEYKRKTINGYYNDLLGRDAELAGETFYLNLLNSGMVNEQVIAFVLGLPEYFNNVGE